MNVNPDVRTLCWLASVVLLAGAAACQRQPVAEGNNAAAPAIGVFLLIHWPDGHADFSRDYPTMARCEAAAQAVLQDTQNRAQIREDFLAMRRRTGHPASETLPEEIVPIPVCLPG
jgi:hypothetical protein